MKLIISDKSILDDYIKIPISFEVNSIYEAFPKEGDHEGYELSERQIDKPYIKDYDSTGGDPADPFAFIKEMDTDSWGFFLLYDQYLPVAGAIAAYNTGWTKMLEGRDDLAVLWDIRVHPLYRGRGLGSSLMEEVRKWAKGRDCSQIKIETQNVNAGACKFYSAVGAQLRDVVHHAYRGNEKDEIQFLWYMDIA